MRTIVFQLGLLLSAVVVATPVVCQYTLRHGPEWAKADPTEKPGTDGTCHSDDGMELSFGLAAALCAIGAFACFGTAMGNDRPTP